MGTHSDAVMERVTVTLDESILDEVLPCDNHGCEAEGTNHMVAWCPCRVHNMWFCDDCLKLVLKILATPGNSAWCKTCGSECDWKIV